MDIECAASDEALLRLTRDELVVLANALNTVCNAVDLPEFTTLLGVNRSEAEALLADLAAVLQRMSPDRGA